MPTYEYECPEHGIFEKFFKTFSEADINQLANCPVCVDLQINRECYRVISQPFPAHLYGSPAGYHKPSATGRHSYKLINEKGNS